MKPCSLKYKYEYKYKNRYIRKRKLSKLIFSWIDNVIYYVAIDTAQRIKTVAFLTLKGFFWWINTNVRSYYTQLEYIKFDIADLHHSMSFCWKIYPLVRQPVWTKDFFFYKRMNIHV